jgi:ABC-2 type transport system ATP-binding protein
MVEFESVSKVYRSLWKSRVIHALDGFSLKVSAGEIFGFLGPNGAGKTTAIHIAMGFTHPSRGTGTLLGKPFGHAPTRRRVGFLAEHVALYHRPAGKLLRFYGELNGIRDPLLSRRVREVLKMVSLEGERNRNVGKFSRGMQQRIGLAQALVNDPDLLILDEPTSALDPLGRLAVREILIAARDAAKTIFLSSHLLSEVEATCDRIAILHKGKLVRVGSTVDLLESQNQSEIIATGQRLDAIPGAEPVNGGARFVVRNANQRQTIEHIWASGGEIVRVVPVRRSLEELFVELTSGPAQSNAPAEPGGDAGETSSTTAR